MDRLLQARKTNNIWSMKLSPDDFYAQLKQKNQKSGGKMLKISKRDYWDETFEVIRAKKGGAP